MSTVRHLSDTRTEEGRVRFLVETGRIILMAEGPGWRHQTAHPTLERAAIQLALIPNISERLYNEALDELQRQSA